MHSIESVAPVIERFLDKTINKSANMLDFFIFHTGGRRIMDERVLHLDLEETDIQLSRDSLSECGNISSGAVLDVLHRLFEQACPTPGDYGLLAAFGPGFTAEMNVGRWVS